MRCCDCFSVFSAADALSFCVYNALIFALAGVTGVAGLVEATGATGLTG